jgi:hypothetical protein
MKSFFLGNGRLVMLRIGKVSSSMLITFIDSTPMIRSNVGFSLRHRTPLYLAGV